jgi:hypothetical protein
MYWGTLTNQKLQFEAKEKARADEAKKKGQVLSGYKNVSLKAQKKGGGFQTKTFQQAIYIDAPKAAPAPAPQPQPQPKAKKPEPKKPEPVEHSPEIKQAKERTNSYKSDILSGKASEDIYDVSSNQFNNSNKAFLNSQQFDFSSKTFDPNKSSNPGDESPQPNEQAQAAQNQLQNYISKYSQFKSSIN